MTEPSEQMVFGDVVDSEPIPGDPAYTEWLRAGRPKLERNDDDPPTGVASLT